MFSVFDYLMPNFLGDYKSFTKHYASPISKSQQPGAGATLIAEGISKLKILHQLVLPFLLRREKDRVLSELPPKISVVVKIPLSNVQQRIYCRFCSSQAGGTQAVDVLQDGADHIPEGTFKVLLYLRLLCTHPLLVLSNKNSSQSLLGLDSLHVSCKLLALSGLLSEAGLIDTDIAAADNDQSLLYCGGEAVSTNNASEGVDDPDDAVGCLRQDKRASIERQTNNSKCLIFAQFSKSLDVVEKYVLTMLVPGCEYVRLDGSVPNKERINLVNEFNTNPAVSILLLTTRVGGVGLNLTAADTVIFLEHDFNPHADLQALDRTRRIGQTKVVKVYKLVATDTIDEKLLSIQQKKLSLSEAIVNTDNSTMYSMGTDRLLDIFADKGKSKELAETDLDHLTDRFVENYKTLSVSYFTDALDKTVT